MKRSANLLSKIGALIGILCLILDSRCAAQSASDALNLCLKTVIPSLFPMFVLAGILTRGLGTGGVFSSWIESLLGLPSGTGSIYLIGLLGGFPVGAQSIIQAVAECRVSKQEGQRMLGYCNNCSPAFLFGIAIFLFDSLWYPLTIWLIQLESSLIVATIWSPQRQAIAHSSAIPMPTGNCVNRAIQSICSVCSMIILAGVFSGFLGRWVYPLLPESIAVLIQGSIELTSGVLGLNAVENQLIRWMLCCIFVNFGGICVLLQINAIASEAGLCIHTCLVQKSVQALCGLMLAGISVLIGVWFLPIPLFVVILTKNHLEKREMKMYNRIHKGGFHHAVP